MQTSSPKLLPAVATSHIPNVKFNFLGFERFNNKYMHKINMRWKDWPYWLKGMFVGFILAILLFVSIHYLATTDIFVQCPRPLFLPYDAGLTVCRNLLVEFMCDYTDFCTTSFIITPIFLILISTFIGLLIGKIKKKK